MVVEKDERRSKRTCRIVIVDDHHIVRAGLAELLGAEPDLAVVGSAGRAEAALELVARTRPDVVLMDLAMPGTGGVHAINELHARHPDVAVVVLTYHKEDTHVFAALDAGAKGYVVKDDSRDELLSAIRSVATGKRYLSPAVCDRVVEGYLAGREPGGRQRHEWEVLTLREREVLKLVAEGWTNREIGERLALSEKTVEKHRGRMMHKLGLRNVAEATAYALSNGLAEVSAPSRVTRSR